jgi:hypothetical protein
MVTSLQGRSFDREFPVIERQRAAKYRPLVLAAQVNFRKSAQFRGKTSFASIGVPAPAA